MKDNDKKTSLCLIVLNYNDYKTTSGFLDRWMNQNVPSDWKVIVVDNCSSDNSFQKLYDKYSENFAIIQTNQNQGYGFGNNFGFKFALEKYHPDSCVICNPDIIIDVETIKRMYTVLLENEDCALVGCKLVGLDGITQRYAWKLPSFWNKAFSRLLIINKLFLSHSQDYSNKELNKKYSYVEVIVGAIFLVKCDCFKDTFLFDEDTFLYGEEEILGFRLKQMGKKLIVCNELSCIHFGSESIKKIYCQKVERWKIVEKSERIFLEKYMKISRVKRIILNIFTFIGLNERLLLTKMNKEYEKKN